MPIWSINLYGMTEDAGVDPAVLALLFTALARQINAAGSLNIADRPQVVFPEQDGHSKLAMPDTTEEEARVSDEETTEAEEAPEAGDEAETAAGAEEEAQEPVHGPFAGASVESLEAELNRRSAEGASVTSDGSPLQDASAADIEAEIQKLQDANVAAPTAETETE